MFKLAHISDLHLGPLPKVSALKLANKRITGFLNWKLKRQQNLDHGYLGRLLEDLEQARPDHTVITGDLVNLALPEEIENAGLFLESMGSPENITAQFGNHDAYVPGALSKAMHRWQAYARSDSSPLSSPTDFPVLRIRDDVAIIACNSASATAPFFATGYFRKDQAARLEEVLKKTRDLCRIVCIHHPPVRKSTHWHKRLVGIGLFQRTLKQQGANLVLHGHTHLASTNQIDGPSGKIPVIGVPATGNSNARTKPLGRYNLFSISRSKNGFNISLDSRAYNSESGKVETVQTCEFS